jgi:hypothetical protein
MKNGLTPWTRGPFELIKHADGHLGGAGDTDRRIAIIGFDNAIEVCIDVFIRLNPRLRGGLQLRNEDVEKATRNYHTKIEWLDNYVKAGKLYIQFSIEEVVWYHSLRNQLYHSGNGMVPEMHVLHGIRRAALDVFSTLYRVNISDMLGDASTRRTEIIEEPLFVVQNNDKMELLRLLVELERVLEKNLGAVRYLICPPPRPRAIKEMWEEYKSWVETPSEWDAAIEKAIPIRDYIVHGRWSKIKADELEESYVKLGNIIKEIKTRRQN